MSHLLNLLICKRGSVIESNLDAFIQVYLSLHFILFYIFDPLLLLFSMAPLRTLCNPLVPLAAYNAGRLSLSWLSLFRAAHCNAPLPAGLS